MIRHHHFDGCRANPQSVRDNLVPDALSHWEELLIPRLQVLVKEDLGEVKKDFLNDVQEAMKHDDEVIINNRFFDEQGSKKKRAGRPANKKLKAEKRPSLFQTNKVLRPRR